MQPSATIPPASTTTREAGIRRLPPAARAAFLQFQAGGDLTTLNPVILALLDDFSHQRSAVLLADLPGDTRLIADLGLDSLDISEVVFAAEDLFGISITNGEIVLVHTLDDLRGFIHVKVAGRPGR